MVDVFELLVYLLCSLVYIVFSNLLTLLTIERMLWALSLLAQWIDSQTSIVFLFTHSSLNRNKQSLDYCLIQHTWATFNTTDSLYSLSHTIIKHSLALTPPNVGLDTLSIQKSLLLFSNCKANKYLEYR